jgi:hypothetical protein
VGYYLGDYILKLVLGFEDRPYTAQYITPGRRKYRTGKYGQKTSSAQVAEELEGRYGILESFVEEEDTIQTLLEDVLAERIDQVLAGKDYDKKDIEKRLPGIEKAFKTMLEEEMLHTRGNVPTAAAMTEGRKSFIKTGLYRSSFRAWVEED